jgi:hypothetical protein
MPSDLLRPPATFSSLSTEMRLMIYAFCEEHVRHTYMVQKTTKGQFSLDVAIHPLTILLLRQPLLQVCRLIRSEILPSLTERVSLRIDWDAFDHVPSPLAPLPREYLENVSAVTIKLDAEYGSPRHFGFTYLLRRVPKASHVKVKIINLVNPATDVPGRPRINGHDAEAHMAELYNLLSSSYANEFPSKNFSLKCKYGEFHSFAGFSANDRMSVRLDGPLLRGKLNKNIKKAQAADAALRTVRATDQLFNLARARRDNRIGFVAAPTCNNDSWDIEYRRILHSAGLNYFQLARE